MKRSLYLFGKSGKMGQSVAASLNEETAWTLTSSSETADLFLDFSVADALVQNLSLATKHKRPLIIGTTGHTSSAFKQIEAAAQVIPLLYASNFSLGIALLIRALKQTKQSLPKHSIMIEETHPATKRDAPSGTALTIARALDATPNTIISHREGDLVFEHAVTLSFGDEALTFKHQATSRSVFADGALLAANFLINQSPGLYAMEDVISL